MDAQHHSRFDGLSAASDRYAWLPVDQAFTWAAVAAEVGAVDWYMVAFRSVRRADADEARLSEYDDRAHDEAMSAPGFVHYFKGPTSSDGSCMSFCLWTDRASARAASGGPHHVAAAAVTLEMYARYDLEFLRVTKRTDETFSFEPFDPPQTPRLSPAFAPA